MTFNHPPLRNTTHAQLAPSSYPSPPFPPQTPPSTENSPILPCAGQKALIKTNAESLKTKNTSIDPKRSHSATPVKKTCTLPTATGQRQLIAPVQTSDASNIQPPTTEEHDSILTSPIATTESAAISRPPSSAENSPKSKNRTRTPRPKNLPPTSRSQALALRATCQKEGPTLCNRKSFAAVVRSTRHLPKGVTTNSCSRHGLKPTKKLPQPDAKEGDFPLPISQPASPARPISYVDPVRAAAESAAPDLTPNLLPIPLHDIFCAQIRTVESVPRRATQAVSSAFDFCLRRSNSALGWWRLLAFAKLVLCAFPSRGGGNRKAQADIELRARRFVEGDFAALWSEAKGTIRTRQSRGGAPITFPVDLDSLPHHLQSALGTAVDVDNLSEVALHRAVSRARLGQYGRAASTLSAATIAADTDVNLQALMDKHPHSPEPILPPPPATERILPLGKGKLKKLLSAFAPGTAPGPSGFRHQFLVDIMRRPGCSIWPQMGDFIARIANGDVPIEVRPFMFGARLIALLKKDDTLRPIACGEFFRRMAGKHLCSLAIPAAGPRLLSRGQFGVGVKGGGEALTSALRRLGNAIALMAPSANPDDTPVCLKVDMSNAFNLNARQIFITAAENYCPVLSRHVRAAYATHSLLFFGSHSFYSAEGEQQGDPLGPLLFSICLDLLLARLPPEIKAALAADDWFLDDGTIVGPRWAVRAYLDFLIKEGPSVGVFINPTKCELISTSNDHRPTFPEIGTFLPFSAWSLLGAPCGDVSFCTNFTDKLLEKAARKNRCIAAMAAFDPHAAYATLRFCGGFALACFTARATPFGNYSAYDDSVQAALTDIGIPATSLAWQQASLPLRHGGLGLRQTALHAPTAFLSAAVDAARLAPYAVTIALPEDPFVGAALAAPLLATFPSVAAKAAQVMQEPVAVAPRHLQKSFSRAIDASCADSLILALDAPSRARVCSLRGPGAQAWKMALPSATPALLGPRPRVHHHQPAPPGLAHRRVPFRMQRLSQSCCRRVWTPRHQVYERWLAHSCPPRRP